MDMSFLKRTGSASSKLASSVRRELLPTIIEQDVFRVVHLLAIILSPNNALATKAI